MKKRPALCSSPSRHKKVNQRDVIEREGAVATAADKNSNDDDCRTGLVYEHGNLHYNVHNRFHMERSTRISAVQQYLLSQGMEQRCCVLKEEESHEFFLQSCDYLRVHLPAYMSRLEYLASCSCQVRLDREAEQFESVYFCQDTFREAKRAAVALCVLVSKVVSGELNNGFAVIRPPGHHAEPGLAGGYCVINNIAIAASYAKERLGCRKILIVDWDVHHGNGTQAAFLNDPSVLYFSVHRYHCGSYFPSRKYGGPTTCGTGEGAGFTVNVGWNQRGMGDLEYLAVWKKLVLPIANEFQPDLVLVSAGFDAAQHDLGECEVTPQCFAKLTESLLTLANGKVICALEGGYVRKILCKCVESVLDALLLMRTEEQNKCEKNLDPERTDILECINQSAAQSIRSTILSHKKYWSCLRNDPSC
mmetsp:Transcript_11639/g.16739  ORF Transcript_11639/g.16739 Transcript_11639/m.16739 type:complete len:419 (-) Transcript_11639:235-1491(-)